MSQKVAGLVLSEYSVVKSQIRTGDLLFCSGKYEFSKLIQKASRSIFSHVAVIFEWNSRLYVLESVEDDGVRISLLSHYLSNYENTGRAYKGEIYIARHAKFPEDSTVAASVIGYGTTLLNVKYDVNALIRIATRVVFGGRGKVVNKELICSELVEECYMFLNVSFFRTYGYVLPVDIAEDPLITFLFRLR